MCLHEGNFLCHVMPHVTQGELYKVLFALTKVLAPFTKLFLLPLQALAECREHAGLSPAEGPCHRRKHDTQQDPGTHSSFLGRDEKGPFSQSEIKPPRLAKAKEDIRNKAVPFPGKLCS